MASKSLLTRTKCAEAGFQIGLAELPGIICKFRCSPGVRGPRRQGRWRRGLQALALRKLSMAASGVSKASQERFRRCGSPAEASAIAKQALVPPHLRSIQGVQPPARLQLRRGGRKGIVVPRLQRRFGNEPDPPTVATAEGRVGGEPCADAPGGEEANLR